MEDQYYTYVLENPASKRYVGQTNNLEERLEMHNSGRSPYTRNKGPWRLVHHERFNTRSEAMKRERFFKSGPGRNWLKKMLS